MQSFLSVFPVFAYLLMTWTVYPFMIVFCLPILTLPASLTYSTVCLPPASTLSTNTVYESALPSLHLMPITDLYLSCDSIKLHVSVKATNGRLPSPQPLGTTNILLCRSGLPTVLRCSSPSSMMCSETC